VIKETPTLREALAAKVAEMRVEFQRLAVRGFMTVPSMQVSMWADELDALLSAYPDDAAPNNPCFDCGKSVDDAR
jgi:hypothetical protein